MLTLLAFLLFAAVLMFCLIKGAALAWAMIFGLAVFFCLGLKKGFSPKQLSDMALKKLPKTLIVLRVMTFVGVLTGIWRSSGTIAFFIYYGLGFITPQLFVLVAFLLSAALSYALGTSFGVAGTAGVVLMAIARAGGVDPLITAGAVMSGIYFGDRNSPASSCASLVAALTETELYRNVRLMFKTALLPCLLCLGFYGYLSVKNPISQVDSTLLSTLSGEFSLSLWVLLPALVMYVLPFLNVPIRYAMAISAGLALVLTVLLQGYSVTEGLMICFSGYHPESGLLKDVMAGGGFMSMFPSLVLITAASFTSGILEGTGVLYGIEALLVKCSGKIGRLPTMSLLAFPGAAIFCNQTIVTILSHQMMEKLYAEKGASHEEMAMDLSNSTILLVCFVPWCIACSVPLDSMEIGVGALPYSALPYLIPLCYLFTKKRFFHNGL